MSTHHFYGSAFRFGTSPQHRSASAYIRLDYIDPTEQGAPTWWRITWRPKQEHQCCRNQSPIAAVTADELPRHVAQTSTGEPALIPDVCGGCGMYWTPWVRWAVVEDPSLIEDLNAEQDWMSDVDCT